MNQYDYYYLKIWNTLSDELNKYINNITFCRGDKTYPAIIKLFIKSKDNVSVCNIGAYVKLQNGGQIPIHVSTSSCLLAQYVIDIQELSMNLCLQFAINKKELDPEDYNTQIKSVHDRIIKILDEYNTFPACVKVTDKKIDLMARSPFTGRKFSTNYELREICINNLYLLHCDSNLIEKIISIIAPTFADFIQEISNKEYIKLI